MLLYFYQIIGEQYLQGPAISTPGLIFYAFEEGHVSMLQESRQDRIIKAVQILIPGLLFFCR